MILFKMLKPLIGMEKQEKVQYHDLLLKVFNDQQDLTEFYNAIKKEIEINIQKIEIKENKINTITNFFNKNTQEKKNLNKLKNTLTEIKNVIECCKESLTELQKYIKDQKNITIRTITNMNNIDKTKITIENLDLILETENYHIQWELLHSFYRHQIFIYLFHNGEIAEKKIDLATRIHNDLQKYNYCINYDVDYSTNTINIYNYYQYDTEIINNILHKFLIEDKNVLEDTIQLFDTFKENFIHYRNFILFCSLAKKETNYIVLHKIQQDIKKIQDQFKNSKQEDPIHVFYKQNKDLLEEIQKKNNELIELSKKELSKKELSKNRIFNDHDGREYAQKTDEIEGNLIDFKQKITEYNKNLFKNISKIINEKNKNQLEETQKKKK